jgi:predicted lactoylglutathione lyase
LWREYICHATGRRFFKTFIKKQIADAGKSAEVIIALSADSKEK